MRPRLIATISALLLQLSFSTAQQAFYDRELEQACRKVARMSFSREGVTRAQADSLADTYFQIYFGRCGGADRAQQHNHHWSVPIVVGYAGTREGAIRVDRVTGAVSYPGKPTVYPKYFPHALSREFSH